jgi:hypothetical protein
MKHFAVFLIAVAAAIHASHLRQAPVIEPEVSGSTRKKLTSDLLTCPFQIVYPPLMLKTWDKPNCEGNNIGISQSFKGCFLNHNLSNYFISQSFRLSRPLQDQEQLDLSSTHNFGSWYHNKDQYSVNSSSCTHFLLSYNAVNGSTACHSTPIFTCHRLWLNPGLPVQSPRHNRRI